MFRTASYHDHYQDSVSIRAELEEYDKTRVINSLIEEFRHTEVTINGKRSSLKPPAAY